MFLKTLFIIKLLAQINIFKQTICVFLLKPGLKCAPSAIKFEKKLASKQKITSTNLCNKSSDHITEYTFLSIIEWIF